MMMLVDEIRSRREHRDLFVLVGAGLSIGATKNCSVASWTGLIANGLDYCKNLGRMTEKLVDTYKEFLQPSNAAGGSGIDDMLAAAQKVATILGASGGDYTAWLRSCFSPKQNPSFDTGNKNSTDLAAIRSLEKLQIPIATTNFDTLIEETLGIEKYPTITWDDPSKVRRWVRGDEKGVLHIHGAWNRPASVVLGIRSYDTVLADRHTQAILQALVTIRSVLFVGFGQGLEDPNFEALRAWMRGVLPSSEYRHYRLEIEAKVSEIQKRHDPEERIYVISYGKEHKDLPDFLYKLSMSNPLQSTVVLHNGGKGGSSPFQMREMGNPRLGRRRICILRMPPTESIKAETPTFLTRISWSPDGAFLAVPASDAKLYIFRKSDWELVETIKIGSDWVLGVAWSSDNSKIASASADGLVRVHNTGLVAGSKAEVIYEFKWHSNHVNHVAWKNDGPLASGSDDRAIGLSSLDSATEPRKDIPYFLLQGHSAVVPMVAWCPSRDLLASGSFDTAVRVWKKQADGLIPRVETLKGHNNEVFCIAWSPKDGRWLASGSGDNTIRVWDMQDWDPPCPQPTVHVLRAHLATVTSVGFYDGSLLASKSHDGTVALHQWDGTGWKTLDDRIEEPSSKWASPGLAFHPSEPTLATLGEGDQVVRIWEIKVVGAAAGQNP